MPATTSPAATVTLYQRVDCMATICLANEADFLSKIDKCAMGAAILVQPTMQLYPNPSTGVLKFKEDGADSFADKIEIIDLRGRPLASFSNTGSINIASLTPAVYFCIIKKNGRQTVQKIARL